MKKNPLLTQLLAPVTLDDFYQHYWETSPLVVKRAQLGYYDHILSDQDLEQYFQNAQLPSQYIRVLKAGEKYLPQQWSKLETRRDFNAVHLVDRQRLFELFDKGASIVIGSIEGQLPALEQYCRGLNTELSATRMGANLYITPPGAKGLDCHFDSYDVLILQISGRKRWQIYDRPIENPLANQYFNKDNYLKPEPTLEITLEEGDLLYLPRGFVHEAHSLDSTSIHITLGLHNKKAIDIFELLAKQVVDNTEFRRCLVNPHDSDQDRIQKAESLRQQLLSLVEDIDIYQLIENDRQLRASTSPRVYQGQYIDRIKLSVSSIVQKMPEIPVICQHHDNETVISVDQASMTIPHLFRSVLPIILSEQPFRISSLPGLMSENAKLKLVQQCIEIGLLGCRSDLQSSISEVESTPGLIPFAIDSASKQVIWRDLGRYHVYEGRFNRAFSMYEGLLETLQKKQASQLATDLSVMPLIQVETVQPSLFIFHTSRCGSTLLTRAMAQARTNLVYGEVEVINDLWSLFLADNDNVIKDEFSPQQAQQFRSLISLLGRRRAENYQQYIIKFPSIYTHLITSITSLYPDVPVMYLYRDPVEVLASLEEGGCQTIKNRHTAFGKAVVADNAPYTDDASSYAIKLLEMNMQAVLKEQNANIHYLDYRYLNKDNLPIILSKLNIQYTDHDLVKMQQQFRFYSKSFHKHQDFSHDSEHKRRYLSDDLKRQSDQYLQGHYKELLQSPKNMLNE